MQMSRGIDTVEHGDLILNCADGVTVINTKEAPLRHTLSICLDQQVRNLDSKSWS